METNHNLFFKDAKKMDDLPDGCVDLVVTSPPYPMIEMWDELFTQQNSRIGKALSKNDGLLAFEWMHRELDPVWNEVSRVLTKGGLACINIGDATRTIDERFSLYPNHSRILTHMQKIGLFALPVILWRKQTNAPNKFMGSGMMPPSAYVTLEHEYVLILRKGNKRIFKSDENRQLRRESAYFWEERNTWFSDVWMDLKGTTQSLYDSRTRARSAAFPFELPYRLITMFSVKGDTVLDPFVGVGTTLYAAMAAGRNSIGYELDTSLEKQIISHLPKIVAFSNNRINQRLKMHGRFVQDRYEQGKTIKYTNKHYQFPVITRQETDLIINGLKAARLSEKNTFQVEYFDEPQSQFVEKRGPVSVLRSDPVPMKKSTLRKKKEKNHLQQSLFKP